MTVALHTTIDGIPAMLPQLRVVRDGRICWFQRDQLSCLQAAIATATQLPYEDCDVRTLRDLATWAKMRRLRMIAHVQPPGGFWVGFAPREADGMRHVVVGLDNRLFHDPASGWLFPGGGRAPATREIEFVISLEPRGATAC